MCYKCDLRAKANYKVNISGDIIPRTPVPDFTKFDEKAVAFLKEIEELAEAKYDFVFAVNGQGMVNTDPRISKPTDGSIH